MLAVLRIIVVTLALVVICICACVYSLFKPFHKNNVYLVCRYLGKVTKLIGLEVEVRIPDSVKNIGPVVYICNHQNTWDMFTLANAMQKNTVTVGKKSLKWMPFFGQMYWLTGNVLIDRKNKNKAKGTIQQTANKIREDKLSIWLFPEGTRSYGKGILPFKTGAFRTASQAEVPVVPICASTSNNIELNRWNNGKMIIEFQEPIHLNNDSSETIKAATQKAQHVISERFDALNEEAFKSLLSENKEKLL